MNHPFAEMAQKQIIAWLFERLREKFPDAQGALKEVNEFIASECERLGCPGAITAEARGETKPLAFVLKDHMQAIMLAAAIFGEKR